MGGEKKSQEKKRKMEDNESSLVLENPRDKRGGRIFERTKRSASLLSSSLKFQFGSSAGLSEEHDEAAMRVEDASDVVLAGWCSFRRPGRPAKQRFLVARPGVLRVAATEAPERVDLEEAALSFSAESAAGADETRVTLGERSFFTTRAGARALFGMAAEERPAEWRRLLVSARRGDGTGVLLLVSGRVLFIFPRHDKTEIELRRVTLDTSEHRQAEHRLSCATSSGVSFVIALPEPLLLLRWIAALTSCDLEQTAATAAPVSMAVQEKLVLQEMRSSSRQLRRAVTLGVTRALDIREQDEVCTREQIKKEMLAASSFPSRVPAAKEILSDPVLRIWAFKWSVTQYSSENVKFYVACDNLFRAASEGEGDAERAAVLRKICHEFLQSDGESAVNISGAQRKRVLKRMADAPGDAELVALLPGILEEPLAEIVRVMEFDIFTGLSSLFREVIQERASGGGGSSAAPSSAAPVSQRPPPPTLVLPLSGKKKSDKQYRSVREMLEGPGLQELLLFASSEAKTDAQNEIIFMATVQLFKSGAADAREIFSTFCEQDSSRFLDCVPHKRFAALEKIMNLPTVPTDAFDACVGDVATHLDAGLFKRYLATKEKKKDKRRLLGLLPPSPTTTTTASNSTTTATATGSTSGDKRSPRGEEKRSPRFGK